MPIHKSIPVWVAPTLCTLFAILWGVWLLPETVFIRHTAMILGAIIGLYVCVIYKDLFSKREAIPIGIIFLLLGWITFHFFFIGTNHALQLQELTGVWKKVVVCIPFAVGLGIAIGQAKQKNFCWNLLYLGLTLPTFIYFAKWVLTKNAIEWNIQSPYLLLNPDYSMPFGISRALYPFYCLPSFVIAVYLIINFSAEFIKLAPLYLSSIFLTPLLFFLEGDKTGLLLSAFFPLIIIFVSLLKNYKKIKRSFIFIVLITCILSGSIFYAFSKEFAQWDMVANNSLIAIDTHKQDYWKYHSQWGVPKNDSGEPIHFSNYARIAWFVVGLRLLHENPFGYGLLTLSFDHLTKNKWPDSILSMTHSGFLDFALGYGYLGIGLLLISSFGVLQKSYFFPVNWSALFWGFGVLILVMLVKELSYEITVNAYIFLILLMSGLALAFHANKVSEIKK
jgi:hypothetical protein